MKPSASLMCTLSTFQFDQPLLRSKRGPSLLLLQRCGPIHPNHQEGGGASRQLRISLRSHAKGRATEKTVSTSLSNYAMICAIKNVGNEYIPIAGSGMKSRTHLYDPSRRCRSSSRIGLNAWKTTELISALQVQSVLLPL